VPRDDAARGGRTLRRAAAREKSHPGTRWRGGRGVIKLPYGEGIRAARIVTLLKKPGEAVTLDSRCARWTEQGVYPIESHAASSRSCAVSRAGRRDWRRDRGDRG